MRRALIIIGLVIALAGIAWPWISRLGRLPGDLVVARPGFRFFLPVTTMLIASLLLSLLLWLLKK